MCCVCNFYCTPILKSLRTRKDMLKYVNNLDAKQYTNVRSEVLMAVNMKITVFLDVASWSLLPDCKASHARLQKASINEFRTLIHMCGQWKKCCIWKIMNKRTKLFHSQARLFKFTWRKWAKNCRLHINEGSLCRYLVLILSITQYPEREGINFDFPLFYSLASNESFLILSIVGITKRIYIRRLMPFLCCPSPRNC